MSVIVDNFSNRLRRLMLEKGVKPQEVCNATGINKSKLSNYRSGKYKPNQATLMLLADYFNVDVAYLLGYNISTKINIYSSVHAGIPNEMIDTIIDTEDINVLNQNKQYFGLKVKGDSMSPKYLENDTIIVEKCEDVESGTDCVVAINGNEAFLKKLLKTDTSIILQAYNPLYEPIVITTQEIHILGKVVEIRRKL